MFLNKIVYFHENHHTIKPKRGYGTGNVTIRSTVIYFVPYKNWKRTKIVPLTLICDLQTKEMFSKRGWQEYTRM